MTLKEYAKEMHVTYRTVWNWVRAGKLETETTPTGRLRVKRMRESAENTVVYCRVSSTQNISNLDSQARRVVEFCAARGWIVNKIIKECASGVNDERPKLLSMLKDKTVTRIVVEHKDRLTRFGYNYIAALLPNVEIVAVNQASDDESDLMADFAAIVTSYCARLYGRRRCKGRAKNILKEMKKVRDSKNSEETEGKSDENSK